MLGFFQIEIARGFRFCLLSMRCCLDGDIYLTACPWLGEGVEN